MSLFGQPTNSTTNAFGSFGSTNTNTTTAQPQTSTNIFGQPNPAPATSTTTSGAGTNIFGQPTNTNGQQKPPSNAFNSIFGSQTQQPQTQTQPAQQGGIFGSFGSNTASTNTTNNTTTTGTGTGGGLFGSTLTPLNTNVSSTTNAGTGTNASAGTNIFGQPASAGGQTQPTQQTGTAGTGGGLFGGGLFGGQNQQQGQQTQQTGQQQGSIFGSQPSTQPQPQQSTSTGAFGNLFGSTASAQPQTQNQQPNPSSSFLGTSAFGPRPSLFAQSQSQLNNLSQPPKSPDQILASKIEEIVTAWNPTSADCKFQWYFYNLVEKGDVARYGRPSNALDGARWERACRENPDPSCLVPVLAIGFDDLQKRVEGQEKLALAHQEKLKELTKSLTSLSQKHVLQNTLLLQRIQSHQTTLTHRLLRLTQHLHLLIPSIRSSSIRPEEEALLSILESIEEELVLKGGQAGGGVGGGRMRGKLNELWGVVGNLQSVRERERRRDGKSSTLSGGGGTEWSVVDEGGFQQIVHVLMEQQHGLAYLTSLLKDRARDIELIKEGIKSGKLGIPTNESGLHGARASRSTSGMSSSFLG